MNNLISVIVPIYNSEKYLERCIESILRQTYKNIQLILINDGSKDKSLEICNYYKSIDDRIIVVDKINEGVSIARNTGIRLAEGDFIGFVDSDDYIEENMYEVLINKIIIDKSDLCAMTTYSINCTIFEDNDLSFGVINNSLALEKLFLLSFPTSLWAYLYKKSALNNVTLNGNIHFFEDFEFNFKVLMQSNVVSLCDKKLYHYETNNESINSQSINDKRTTCLRIYDLISEEVELKARFLIEYMQYFRAHFLSSVIISVIKSNNVEKKYFKLVKKESMVAAPDVLRSKYVPVKYKVAITVCSICPKVLYLGMFYKRR